MFEVLTNKACELVLISLADATRILETIVLRLVLGRLKTLLAVEVINNFQRRIRRSNLNDNFF